MVLSERPACRVKPNQTVDILWGNNRFLFRNTEPITLNQPAPQVLTFTKEAS
jgi:hypothetical protein